MPKISARALALEIISICFNPDKSSFIKLTDSSSEVENIKIIMNPQWSDRLSIQLNKFVYHPRKMHEFNPAQIIQKEGYEINHQIEFLLLNSQDDYYDDFINKSNLIITGSYGGMILLAEYLLNFGNNLSTTNYINFERDPIDKIDIAVSKNSCSGRIEVSNIEYQQILENNSKCQKPYH